MKNKRGVEMNIATMVVIVLVLLLLVIVTIGFSGGMGNFWKTIFGQQKEFNQDDINAKKTDCEARDVFSYCTQQVSLANQKTGNVTQIACYTTPINADLRYAENQSVWISHGNAQSYCTSTYGASS
jgi:hypothetical protein